MEHIASRTFKLSNYLVIHSVQTFAANPSSLVNNHFSTLPSTSVSQCAFSLTWITQTKSKAIYHRHYAAHSTCSTKFDQLHGKLLQTRQNQSNSIARRSHAQIGLENAPRFSTNGTFILICLKTP